MSVNWLVRGWTRGRMLMTAALLIGFVIWNETDFPALIECGKK